MQRQHGWLDATCRYCIKTAKPISKPFRPSESPIILVSSDPCADTQFQGYPFSGRVKYMGWEKLAMVVGNLHVSRKWCEIGRWLLWNVNRKSWLPDWMVSSSMTLSDLWPDFKVTILTSQISQKQCILGTRLLNNTNRKPRLHDLPTVPVSMTEWPLTLISRSRTFFNIEYLRNDTR